MTEPSAPARGGGWVRALKIAAVLLVGYAGLVAAFESMLGYMQPSGQGTLTITTTGEDGGTNDRVLARLRSNGDIYVAVNHWPRAWYRRALANPSVEVTLDDNTSGSYLAVPATEEEHARVDSENPRGIVFLVMTGFPPRYFLRLDPQ